MCVVKSVSLNVSSVSRGFEEPNYNVDEGVGVNYTGRGAVIFNWVTILHRK